MTVLSGVIGQFTSASRNHVALFLPSLGGGGAERVMVTLANGMARRGHAVDLVLGRAVGAYLAHVDQSIRLVDLNVGRVLKSVWPLARYLRAAQPAVLLSAINHANVAALLARRVSGAPTRVVVTEHNTITAESARVTGWMAKLVYGMVRRLYPSADGIVAVSKSAAGDLAKFIGVPSASVHAIYNPFDLQQIASLALRHVDHPWFGAGERPVLLSIGRLTAAKDFVTLVRAFATLRQRLPARLLILGEGEMREELVRLAISLGLTADDIQMPGFISNPFSYLGRCSAFVLSSRWEGLPSVIIEAMACGAQVVSTDCPSGPREILADGKWGRLVPVGDIHSLAATLEDVLSTPSEELPNVKVRALDFDQELALDAYLDLMGLPRLITREN